MLQLGVRGLIEDMWLQHWRTCTLRLHCGQHCEQMLPVVQLHIMYYSPGNHTVPTTLNWALLRDEWLHTTTAKMLSCTQPRNKQSPSISHRWFSTSGCVWNIMVHMQIHLRYNTSHHMIKWGYGDFGYPVVRKNEGNSHLVHIGIEAKLLPIIWSLNKQGFRCELKQLKTGSVGGMLKQ
jgi:hypothetical protein